MIRAIQRGSARSPFKESDGEAMALHQPNLNLDGSKFGESTQIGRWKRNELLPVGPQPWSSPPSVPDRGASALSQTSQK